MNIRKLIEQGLGEVVDYKAMQEAMWGRMFHRPTQQKHARKHRGVTKPVSGEPKWQRKMAARSRRINRRMR